MSRDDMDRGDSESAVRILPAPGGRPNESSDRNNEERSRRTWMLPAVVAATALLAFVALTAGDGEETAVPTTTLPPGLSAVSTELVDISSTSDAPPVTEEWDAIDFAGSATINGIIEFDGSLAAFGATRDGALVWTSGSGMGWREVSRFESPDTIKSSVDYATVWNRTIVALGSVNDGAGVWTARNLSNWSYHGPVPGMEADALVGIAASDEVVLAITATPLGNEAWTSADGINWTSSGEVETLENVSAVSVHFYDGWYYATGAERCDAPPCHPVIYRSADGKTWTAAAGVALDVFASHWGEVVDIAHTGEGLVATGHTDGEVAVWRSSDGSEWSRIAADDAVLRGATISLQLQGVSADGDRVADLTVDDRQHRVAVGSRLLTDVGMITIAAIEDDYVMVELADSSGARLETGQVRAVRLHGVPESIAAGGKRIAIAGSVGLGEAAAPAVWTSSDGGASWQLRVPQDWSEGRFTAAAIVRGYVTVTGGEADQTPLVWRSIWDTSAQEEVGLTQADAYFAAAASGNATVLLELLPEDYGRFQLPSLGGVDLQWWGERQDHLDTGAVVGTLDYLGALHTQFATEDCTARTIFRDTETVQVTCDFTVDSDLLRTYSDNEHRGVAEIIIEDGILRQVQLTGVPSASMWQMLVDGTAAAAAEDRATLVGGTAGTERFNPTFTGQTAEAHLRLAAGFVAGLLRPGETRVVDTGFGTMEWTWTERLPIPVSAVPWMAPYDGGFVAVGQGTPEAWTDDTSVWTTTDGYEWEEMPAPQDASSLWNLQSFRDGLLGQAWNEETTFLVYFDGDAWSNIMLPAPPEGRYLDVTHIAASGDTLLVLTQTWSEDWGEPQQLGAWLIGSDNIPQPTNFPVDIESEWGDPVGLVGTKDGFMLTTSRYGSPEGTQVWHSPDGQRWSEIAATTSLDDATYVWNLQHHRDRFFVVGEGAETVCTEGASGACEYLVGVWSSPDGAEWARVLTTSGEAVSTYEIGSGPLGLVAVGMESWNEQQLPRPIYMSTDGEQWERAGSLNLIYPDTHWFWLQTPAVGEDMVLIPGSAYDETGEVDADIPFLIVGRVIDK